MGLVPEASQARVEGGQAGRPTVGRTGSRAGGGSGGGGGGGGGAFQSEPPP